MCCTLLKLGVHLTLLGVSGCMFICNCRTWCARNTRNSESTDWNRHIIMDLHTFLQPQPRIKLVACCYACSTVSIYVARICKVTVTIDKYHYSTLCFFGWAMKSMVHICLLPLALLHMLHTRNSTMATNSWYHHPVLPCTEHVVISAWIWRSWISHSLLSATHLWSHPCICPNNFLFSSSILHGLSWTQVSNLKYNVYVEDRSKLKNISQKNGIICLCIITFASRFNIRRTVWDKTGLYSLHRYEAVQNTPYIIL